VALAEDVCAVLQRVRVHTQLGIRMAGLRG